MKKTTFLITFSLSLILFCGFLFIGCRGAEGQKRTEYNIELSFDGENTLQGRERVFYQNNTDNTLSFIQFNLFANAFKDKDSVVTVAEEGAYYNGMSEGKIEILSVKRQDNPLEIDFEGENQEIMRVYLEEEIYPEEEVEISIDFVVTLADINHRLGRGENTINLGNFYPIISVYENGKGFYQNVYKPFGDPFYSQVADYEVKISCPDDFCIASSGYREGEVFKGENMRDFALVLSKKFSSVKGDTSNCEVEYFGYQEDENLDECLEVSINAVEYFSKQFGDYPYKKLSVVKNSFVQGGMEYPSLVMISDNVEDVFYVIVHEIAHQWWYGVVGNNEYESAWLDEGLAEYSTLMFFRDNENYGVNFDNAINGCLSSYKIYERVQKKVYGKVDGAMDKNLDEFSSSPEYVALVYTKSTLMFNCLENQLGERKFLSSLKNFYNDFSFKEVSRADVIASFSSSSHRDLEGFFNSWLDGKIVIA